MRSDRDGPRPYVRHRRPAGPAAVAWSTSRRRSSALTRMRIPKNFNGRNPQTRRDLASALRARTHDLTPPPPRHGGGRRGGPGTARGGPTEIDRLRAELRAHPCHGCPDREDHARWAERWFKLRPGRRRPCKRRVEQRTNTIARQFDRVCEVLTALGLPRGRRRSPRPGAHADADLHRDGPGRRRVRCGTGCGTTSSPPSWPRRCRRWSSRPGGPTTPRSPAAARRPGQAGARRDGLALGRPRRARARAQARLPARARPRLRLGGVPLGRGRRARRGARPRPTSPPATSCAG